MNAKQINTMVGRLVEHQSEFGGLSTKIGQQVIQDPKGSIAFFVEQLKARGVVGNEILGNKYLRCISNGQSLIIPACDGQRIIAEAKEVFPGYIDDNFRIWKADEIGAATSDTLVSVSEIKRAATFEQIFGVDASNLADVDSSNVKRLRQMIHTQDQIIGFVEKYRNWLRTDGYATLFPFESYGNFFVAYVSFDSGGSLGVCVDRFEDGYVWGTGYRLRVVVPQLV